MVCPTLPAAASIRGARICAALAGLPNVTCKLSGVMAYCAPGDATYAAIKHYVDHVLETFGPDRMFWGSELASRRNCQRDPGLDRRDAPNSSRTERSRGPARLDAPTLCVSMESTAGCRLSLRA